MSIALIRNKPENAFTSAVANGDSPFFALFSKPIEPLYITFTPTFSASFGCTVTAFIGVLGPLPIQPQSATNSKTLAPVIIWQPSAGTSAVSGTPIIISGKPGQFVKFTISSFTGPGAKTISNVQVTASTAVITATAHGFTSGDTVTVAAVTNTAVNGTFVLTSVTTNTFTYAFIGTVANASDTGTATDVSGISGVVSAS